MADEEVQINPALELYLREKHHVNLPAFDEEPAERTLESVLELAATAVAEQGWQVKDTMWLSTFSFESLVIYKDLLAMADVARANPVVAAFARAREIDEKSEDLGENLDDLEIPKTIPVSVLPADASQLQALAIAASGKHIVIHGPPGTGKSQTISNLIADALGRGKKVLFVSAKMAALDVVYDRLVKLGLQRYCLEAHSTKASKAKIIEELKRTLELPLVGGSEELREQIVELKRVRSRLNLYVKEIHLKHAPLGWTVYQAIGKIEQLSGLPKMESDMPWEDVINVDRDQLRVITELLEDLSTQADLYRQRHIHPWRGIKITADEPIRADSIKKNLKTIVELLDQAGSDLATLSELLTPARSGFSLSDLRELHTVFDWIAKCAGLPRRWGELTAEELAEFKKISVAGQEKSEKYQTGLVQLINITSLCARELRELLDPVNERFASWTRVLKPEFWKWKSIIKSQLPPNTDTCHATLRSYRELAAELEETERWFGDEGIRLAEYVSNPLLDSAALSEISIGFKLAECLNAAIAGNIICKPIENIGLSRDIREKAHSIAVVLSGDTLRQAASFIDSFWPEGFVGNESTSRAEISRVLNRCHEILGSMERLHEWLGIQSVISRCVSAGLGTFLRDLGEIGVADAPEIFRRTFLERWVTALCDESATLREFSGISREEQIRRFAEVDSRIRDASVKQIKSTASEPARRVAAADCGFGNAGEIGILRRELQKRRRIRPLRRLFAEIPQVLQAIKPCLLMSPISVSTFLKPDGITFDLVVFDEASQLPTPETIPSILRAKQVVVAGDENQLPPTSFFLATSIFDQEDSDGASDDFEPLESLLDDCVAVKPVFAESKIVWHYRSKDERLINFSNHFFYNNSLITFPSSSTSNEGRGVRLVYTPDGIWDRGRSRTNRFEAKRVAELILECFSQYPQRSLGVVAMNASQREAIEYALDEEIEKRPDLMPLLDCNRLEPFFIKSLENVQGDERDIIIISVGYAKTADGALSLNFGPLNREGGWRRLNVLVTRAKWETILITSLQSRELSAVSPINKGAVMLRNFIQYAERGAQLPPEPAIASSQETNDFEEGVAAALRNLGIDVDEQVGAGSYRIDLAVRDNRDGNCYVMAIECDGATYHSARSARDRDLLRHEILRSQGWKIHRLWSTDWFRDRAKALQGIVKSLELAYQAPLRESVQGMPAATAADKAVSDLELECVKPRSTSQATMPRRRYSGRTTYEKYRTSLRNRSRVLMNSANGGELASVIAEIVKIESPIHMDLLLERLKEIFGVARAGSNIIRNVTESTRIAVRRNAFVLNELGFIYRDRQRPSGFRVPFPGEQRALEQVAPEEIENAILYLVEDQFGFSKEELPRAIVELFGYERVGSERIDHVASTADRLMEHGLLRLSGFTLYLT